MKLWSSMQSAGHLVTGKVMQTHPAAGVVNFRVLPAGDCLPFGSVPTTLTVYCSGHGGRLTVLQMGILQLDGSVVIVGTCPHKKHSRTYLGSRRQAIEQHTR